MAQLTHQQLGALVYQVGPKIYQLETDEHEYAGCGPDLFA
jgi:hypothetical protein